MPARLGGGGRAPALPPATLPRQPAREDDVLPSGGDAAGEDLQDLQSGRKQSLHGAPRRIHEQCGARAGLGGRRQGGGLACAAAGAPEPKNGADRPPVFEQDVPQLPLVEVFATRRGVRQQPGAAPAAFQAQESRRGTSGVPGCWRRACPGGRRAGTPRQGRPPTGRGQPLAGLPRQWRRYASSPVRCRCPSPPASRGSRGIRPAWRIAANPGGPGRSGPT